MANRRGALVAGGLAALLAVGGVAWMALQGPSGPRTSAPAEAPPAETAPVASGDAPAPRAAGPAAVSDAGPALGGTAFGRLVRGRPPRPLPGTVTLSPQEGGGSPVSVTAGEDGRFRLENLPLRRDLLLRARSPGLLERSVPGVHLRDRDPLDLGDLTLGLGQRVDVVVVDGLGGPVEKARVTLHPSARQRDPRDWIVNQFHPPAPVPATFAATTGKDGRVLFDAVPPGTWSLVATADRCGDEIRWLEVVEGALREAERVILRPACTLSGRVLGEGATPVPGVTVRVVDAMAMQSPLGPSESVSDAEGRYRFDRLAAGVQTLQALLPGGALRTARTVRLPEVAAIDLYVGDGVAVAGRVLDDATGAPVAGARVSLQAWDNGSGDGHQGFALAETDGTGGFRVEGLPPGNLAPVQVRADGYVPHPDARAAQDMGRALSAGASVTVEVRLLRGATVRGRVRGPGDAPVAAARVSLSTFSQTTGLRETPPALTAADGTYSIGPVSPGVALVTVTAEGLFQAGLPEQPWQAMQNPHTLPDAVKVDVPASGEIVRDIVLSAGGTVAGVVVDGAGTAAPGIAVSVPVPGPNAGQAAVTDGEGKFLLAGIAPGERLTVAATGPAGRRGTSEPFAMAEGGAVADVRVELMAAGRIGGRVRREDGTPLRSPTLRVAEGAFQPEQPWDWQWREQSARRRTVAADGAFLLDDLAPGTYTLIADDDGAASTRSKGIEVKGGEGPEDVEIVLPSAQAISGKVLNDAGEPLAGAALSLLQQNSRQFGWNQPGPAVATSGADGTFVLEDAGPGNWTVRATAPGLMDASAVAKGGAKDIVLTLKVGLTISGIVVSDPDGAPLPDVPVTANPSVHDSGSWVNIQATTGPDGRFTLRGLRDRPHEVTAGQAWGEGTGDLVPTTVSRVQPPKDDLRIAVPHGGTIAGRLLDAVKGTPLGGLNVMVQRELAEGASPAGNQQRWGQVKPDGTFRISGLIHGTYTLMFNSYNQGAGVAPTTVKGVAAGTLDLVVRAGEGVPITGRVQDEDGSVPKGRNLHIMVMPRGLKTQGWSPEMQWAQVKEDGTFATQPLDPSREYDLTVAGLPQGRLATLQGVRPGGAEVTLRATAGGTIAGRVLDGEGKAVGKGVPVRAQMDGAPMMWGTGNSAWGQTADDGTFTLQGLAAGQFRVTAGGPGSPWQPAVAEGLHGPGATGVEVRVQAGFTLSGRLVDGAGSAASIEHVLAAPEGGGDQSGSWISVKEDRTFSISGLPRGRVTLKGLGGGRQLTLGTFDVPLENVQVPVPAE